MSKLAVLVDGSSFIYRAYYALPQLTRHDGKPVGAVYGFCSMLISLLEKHKSDLFCVALDSGRQTFRSEIYKEYKANRDEAPKELKSQFSMLREACVAFGVPTVEKKGYEADDIIATYSVKLSAQGYDVRIIASDKDLMQLINEKVSLFDPIKSKIIMSEQVQEKYNVLPSQMKTFQALMGDSSDNIPGIEGIGPKTAAKLINEYQTIEGIYENINLIKQQKLRENLINQRENLDISLRLVTLKKDVDIDEDFDKMSVTYDNTRIVDFLKSYDFDSLIKRLSKNDAKIEGKKRPRTLISTVQDLKNFFELNRVKKFSFFCSSCEKNRNILTLCCDSRTAYCVFSLEDEVDLFSQSAGMGYDEICDTLKAYFENPDIIKIGLRNGVKCFHDISFSSYDDISVMAYLLCGTIGDTVESLFPENGSSIAKLSFQNVCEISQVCEVCELAYDYYDIMIDELSRRSLLTVYQKIDRPLIGILKNMEENGILISPQKLHVLAEEISEKIKEVERQIFNKAGCEFNIGSVKQLSEVLFDKLRLSKPVKKSSLDVESLEELAMYSEVPALVIEWRKLSKLLSNYTYSLCKLINPKTNRVHSTFNMTSTVTGRLSSSNPNLQNIPDRTAYGKRVRQAFISESGSKLVSFDYSQIELRVLAHLADIHLLKEAFVAEKDVHAITAANVFGVDLQAVTQEMRSHAKTINFGIIYGMSPFRLSRVLGIPLEKASSYIKNYFARFSEFESFKQKSLEFARKNGYVLTISGRRCYIKDILSKNYQLKQFSERQAVNAVIQGSASDIVKMAMIDISPKLRDFHSKMLIQIHDELVFETEDNFIDSSIPVFKGIMENATVLSVPLKVNVELGEYLK